MHTITNEISKVVIIDIPDSTVGRSFEMYVTSKFDLKVGQLDHIFDPSTPIIGSMPCNPLWAPMVLGRFLWAGSGEAAGHPGVSSGTVEGRQYPGEGPNPGSVSRP